MNELKLSAEIAEYFNKPTTTAFLNAAKQFVTILETVDIGKEKFYRESQKALAELYLTGLNLEQIDLKYSGPDSDFDDDKLFANKNAGYISQLGKDAFYWEVFDPIYEKENEPTQGWLVDDFIDIYQDLKIELTKIETIGSDEAIEDAFWQLRFGFYHHWGNHCINALRAIHYLWYDGKVAM